MIYNVSLPKKKLQNYEKKNKDKYDLDRCGFHIFFFKYFLYGIIQFFIELSAK